jgi:hypothetical protein
LRTRFAWLLLACCVASAQPAASPPGGALHIDEIVGDGWRARDLELAWHWTEDGASGLELAIAELELPGLDPLLGLRLACADTVQDAAGLHCAGARVALADLGGEAVQGTLGFSYQSTAGTLELDLRRLQLCSGAVRGVARVGPRAWHAALALEGVAADCVAGLAGEAVTGHVGVTAGRVSGEIELGSEDDASVLELDLALADLTFGDATGALAGETLAGRVAGALRSQDAGWTGHVEIGIAQGALYRDPVLLDAALAPLALRADLVVDDEGGLEVSGFELAQGDALQLAGRFSLRGAPRALAVADLTFASRALDGFYAAWLQPLLIGTALDDLALDGSVSGRLSGAPGGWAVDAELVDVALRDRGGRFALGGLAGRLAWGDAESAPSALRWAGGQLLGLAVGESQAEFTLREGTLRLLAPLRQPLVDGALKVGGLVATANEGSGIGVTLQAELEPISLEALGYAFGWPLMAGQVGGSVPTLRFAEGTLAVDGELRVDLFDGTIRIREPRLERPLGPLAALHADVVVDDLDLELLTRTFTIGRIEGRLDGRIDGLLLHDWRPVRFDARFGTPPDDDSRHRISQRAVDSITSIGGLGGVLSQGALRFFDEFRYSRLGFSCRLRGAVCELDGVEPAAAGYYLVRGGGLPRIDIIGHVRRVDWAELVERVQRAMAAPAPLVK